jgi:hypothetical protein
MATILCSTNTENKYGEGGAEMKMKSHMGCRFRESFDRCKNFEDSHTGAAVNYR